MAYSIGFQDFDVIRTVRPLVVPSNPTVIASWPRTVRTVYTGALGLTGTGFRPLSGQLYPRGVR